MRVEATWTQHQSSSDQSRSYSEGQCHHNQWQSVWAKSREKKGLRECEAVLGYPATNFPVAATRCAILKTAAQTS